MLFLRIQAKSSEKEAKILLKTFFIFNGLLVAVLVLMITSTAYDIFYDASNCKHFFSFNYITEFPILIKLITGEKCQQFLVFSVYTNGRHLFSYQNIQSPNVIECLYGIRSITSMWVIVVRTYCAFVLLPNRENLEFIKVINHNNKNNQSIQGWELQSTYKNLFRTFSMAKHIGVLSHSHQ